ncbi:hypothetical protein GCM10027280_00530 [Micromonospora polyrhachis]|uniref:Tellurite resistance protein TerB n=1 Tax=Micromonospora polyrhachis TaxID=1282883 RepID=A0A7W7SN31_9ACTN|nr:hypothetical protein [Micromonospora polyrhachis]MBB4957651.1 hypothetical protein [Micromonospora polyrhachis]
MDQQLTDEERQVVKTAAFGAVFLVSNADPGVLDLIKESFAASGAFADSTGLIREVLTSGGLPRLASDSPADVEREVLPALRQAVQILEAKVPAEADRYRTTVVAAVEQVGQVSAGITEAEAAMIVKIRSALGLSG